MSYQFNQIKPLDRPPTMAKRVAEHLARLMAEGSLRPGQKLPGESELARMVGVSRPTVREALGMLKMVNLVEVRPRSGTYVRNALPGQANSTLAGMMAVDPAKIWELLEIRRVVDTAAAAMAAKRRNTADLDSLRDLVDSLRGISGDTLLLKRGYGRSYARFFSLLAQATHNVLYCHLVEWISQALRNALPYSRALLATHPQAGELIRRQILAIMEAVEAGHPEAAHRATLEHIQYLEDALRSLHQA